MDDKPHWAWPHAIAVLAGIVAYFLVYRFTGDSDLFIALAVLTAGAGGWAATWAYIRFFVLGGREKS